MFMTPALEIIFNIESKAKGKKAQIIKWDYIKLKRFAQKTKPFTK